MGRGPRGPGSSVDRGACGRGYRAPKRPSSGMPRPSPLAEGSIRWCGSFSSVVQRGPWGLCEQHGQSYLTRRRRGEAGDGGWFGDRWCFPVSVSLGVVPLVLARFVEVPVGRRRGQRRGHGDPIAAGVVEGACRHLVRDRDGVDGRARVLARVLAVLSAGWKGIKLWRKSLCAAHERRDRVDGGHRRHALRVLLLARLEAFERGQRPPLPPPHGAPRRRRRSPRPRGPPTVPPDAWAPGPRCCGTGRTALRRTARRGRLGHPPAHLQRVTLRGQVERCIERMETLVTGARVAHPLDLHRAEGRLQLSFVPLSR